MAAEESHAAEYTIVVADQLIVIGGRALIAGIDIETGHTVDGRGADKVLAHKSRSAGSHAAAALDAAIKLEDFDRLLVVHALFLRSRVKLLAGVDPGLDLFVHAAEPGSRIHGEVSNDLEDRKRMQGDVGRERARLCFAGEAGAPVDHHRAGTADTGAAAEVELQGGILLFPDHVERHKEVHAGMLRQLIGLHVRLGGGILRVVTEYIEGQCTSHGGYLP